MSNSKPTPKTSRGPTEPLGEYRNEHGRLIHPAADRVFACPACDEASPRYHQGADPWCPTCGASFPADAVRERPPRGNTGGLDPAGELLDAAPPDTPVDELAELEVSDR